jgi:poly [ADP-ribose] polymerase
MSNQVIHRRFVCVESEFGTQGHNKYWNITVFDNGDVLTEWGRVGDETGKSFRSSTKSFGSTDRAELEADKMIKKKERGKKAKGSDKRDSVYTEVEVAGIVQGGSNNVASNNVSIERKAAEQIAKGDSHIEDLVVRFARENVHNITNSTTLKYDEATGLFSTPLGVIGSTSINSARDVLANIRTIVDTGDLEHQDAPKLIDQYMRLVPQDVGRNRPTLELICPTIADVDKQVSILDSLQASLDMINKPKDKPEEEKKVDEPKIWDITLKLCTDTKEINRIKKFYSKTQNRVHACHHLKVKNVYHVCHHGMDASFKSTGEALGNVWELWHGTRIGNILSILSKGMIIPPSNQSHCTGRMFGDGLYFSDQSTKSLNYAYGYWGGGSSSNNCFMFLVDVAMGKHYTPSSYGYNFPKKGYDSTFAKGGKSGVQNNEMIVYKTYQASPRFLIEFE